METRFVEELEALLNRARERELDPCFIAAALEDALYRMKPERARYFQALREHVWGR